MPPNHFYTKHQFPKVYVLNQPPGGDGNSLPSFFRCLSFVINTVYHFSIGTLHSDSCVYILGMMLDVILDPAILLTIVAWCLSESRGAENLQ